MGAKADLDFIVKRTNKAFRGKNKSDQKKLIKKMGLASIDIIVKRTRRGYGVKRTGGNRKKLASLSKGYVNYRQKNRNRLSRFTSPRKSNLTFTGQMLSSVKILKAKSDSFEIGPSGKRRDGKRNADVSRWVSGRRPFMNLGRKEIREIREILERSLRTRLK